MGLEIQAKGMRLRPRVRCDGCGDFIEQGLGNVLHPLPDNKGAVRELLFFHKHCDHQLHRQRGRHALPSGEMWMDLDVWLMFLLTNSGYKVPAATRHAKTVSEFG
jgi:hypothetical protein